MKRFLLFIIIVIPVIVILAFGLTRDPNLLPSALLNKPAPDFSLVDLEGKTVQLSSLKGSIVVVNFWATWCGPCLQEHQILQWAKKEYQSEPIHWLGIVYQDQESEARSYLKKYGQPFVALFDPQSKVAIEYGVGGVPETFFIDKDGMVRNKLSGVLTMEYLEQQLETLLNQ